MNFNDTKLAESLRDTTLTVSRRCGYKYGHRNIWHIFANHGGGLTSLGRYHDKRDAVRDRDAMERCRMENPMSKWWDMWSKAKTASASHPTALAGEKGEGR